MKKYLILGIVTIGLLCTSCGYDYTNSKLVNSKVIETKRGMEGKIQKYTADIEVDSERYEVDISYTLYTILKPNDTLQVIIEDAYYDGKFMGKHVDSMN